MSNVFEMHAVNASYSEENVLKNVSLSMQENTVLGLVGESGCGKSTTARLIAGLLKPAAGTVRVFGQDPVKVHGRSRLRVQMIFQNPDASLNPRRKIGAAFCDALLFSGVSDRRTVRQDMMRWIRRMHLPEDTPNRLPESFSGGQKQRIALALALCVHPDLLIADEPTSALDVTVQLDVLHLLKELIAEMHLSVLFISHDLGVIRYICSDVAVMHQGQIVELAPAEQFFKNPASAYSRTLLDSVPILSPERNQYAENRAS